MYVNQIRNTAISASNGKRRLTGGSGFDAHLGGGQAVSGGAKTSVSSQVVAMDALMALQAVNPDGGRKREQVDRSNALLDELESLKADLLSGKVDGTRLQRISELVARHAVVDDPALADLIAQIDLRAQVEMEIGRAHV